MEAKESKQDWWHEILENGSQQGWSFEDYSKALKHCLEEDVERDLNRLDSNGDTALHAAVKLEGKKSRLLAVKSLLVCGADFNTTDSSGKTPLAYLPTVHIDAVCAICFVVRINLLAYLGLPVCSQNRQWYRDWHGSLFGDWDFSSEDAKDEISEYALYEIFAVNSRSSSEVKALQGTQLVERLTLVEVLSDSLSDEELVRQVDELKVVVESEGFDAEFANLGGLVKQRYRKAIRLRNIHRKQLKPLAMRAVEILFKLPDICNELIVSFLPFNDFTNLLQALEINYRGIRLGREFDDDFDLILEDIACLFL